MDTLTRFDFRNPDVFGLGHEGWLPAAIKTTTLLAHSVLERDDRQALFLSWQLRELASAAGAVPYAEASNAIESAIRSQKYVRAGDLVSAALEQMEIGTQWLDRRARMTAKHAAKLNVATSTSAP